MNPVVLAATALSTFLVAGLVSAPAEAANARRPYSNIDRRYDAGNDTGNAETDRLNSMQLNRGPGPAYPGRDVAPPSAYYAPPGLYPQPGYGPAYPPPPGYAPTPYPPAYYPPRY